MVNLESEFASSDIEDHEKRKAIGTLLRKSREAKGWTWNRTATETGLKADQIKSIELGDKAYTIDSLLALSKAVGLRLVFQANGSGAAFTKGSTGSDDAQG